MIIDWDLNTPEGRMVEALINERDALKDRVEVLVDENVQLKCELQDALTPSPSVSEEPDNIYIRWCGCTEDLNAEGIAGHQPNCTPERREQLAKEVAPAPRSETAEPECVPTRCEHDITEQWNAAIEACAKECQDEVEYWRSRGADGLFASENIEGRIRKLATRTGGGDR